MPAMKSLPKLVIFRDLRKQGVNEAIDEFLSFARDKAEIVASYGIEDLKQTCMSALQSEDAKQSSFACDRRECWQAWFPGGIQRG